MSKNLNDLISHPKFLKKRLLTDLGLKSSQKLGLLISGGLDSMALLELYSQLALSSSLHLEVIHFNHHLRGQESIGDAAFVEEATKRKNLPLRLIHLPIKKGPSIQARARAERLKALTLLSQEEKITVFLTAHHGSDHLETLLMALRRGAGFKGLAILENKTSMKNFSILRPLLPFSRAEILGFAKKHGLSWREDSSNKEDNYLRNRLRHWVTPFLGEFNPHRLQKTSRTLASSLSQKAKRFIQKNASPLKFALCCYQLPLKDYQGLSPSLRFEVVREITGDWDQQKQEELDGMLASKRAGTKKIWECGSFFKTGQFLWALPKNYLTPLPNASRSLWLSQEAIKGPLALRKARKSDCFSPYGRARVQKVFDYLEKQGIPSFLRDQTLILEDEMGVVALVGFEIDHRVALIHPQDPQIEVILIAKPPKTRVDFD